MWEASILHIDMDAFFVEVERLRSPELRDRPVVVGAAGPRGVVASASYEARGFGIRSAMPMSRARRVCPDLVIVPADHAEYRRVSEQIFEIFRATTPAVEGISIDEAFLDVSGLRLHFPSPVAIARDLRHRIRQELNLPSSVGIAGSKFVAKLASEAAKPDGLLQVPVETQVSFLHALEVRALWGVGAATQATLQGLGIVTVADLAGAHRPILVKALGESLADHLLSLSMGIDLRPVSPDSETKSISAEETFDVDVQSEDQLLAVLRGMADKVASRARRAGLAGRTVTLKVRFPDFETVTRSRTLPAETDSGIELYHEGRELLGKVKTEARGVRLIGIGLSGLGLRGTPRQLGLQADQRWSEVEAVTDNIRDRFGETAVIPARSAPPPPVRSDPDERGQTT